MSDEREIKLQERILSDSIRIVRPEIIMPERNLISPIRIIEKSCALPKRVLEEAVRFHGQSFDPALPILISGPSDWASSTTAVIQWDVNIPAYHRVRYRKSGVPTWTYTSWSISASTHASVSFPVESDRTYYYYDIQSCIVGDGSAAFDWYPGDNTEGVYSDCSGIFGMANWSATKEGGGKLTYLKLSWTTTKNMSMAEVDGTGLNAQWSSSDMTHDRIYTSFKFLDGTYSWRTRNRNKCYSWCSFSAWKYFTISGGEINFQW